MCGQTGKHRIVRYRGSHIFGVPCSSGPPNPILIIKAPILTQVWPPLQEERHVLVQSQLLSIADGGFLAQNPLACLHATIADLQCIGRLKLGLS